MGKLGPAVKGALHKTGTLIVKWDFSTPWKHHPVLLMYTKHAPRIWGSVSVSKWPVLSRTFMASRSSDDVGCSLSVFYENLTQIFDAARMVNRVSLFFCNKRQRVFRHRHSWSWITLHTILWTWLIETITLPGSRSGRNVTASFVM